MTGLLGTFMSRMIFITFNKLCLNTDLPLLFQVALDQQLKKKPQGSGPLAEIDFWRERNAILTSLACAGGA